jgi:hypothetical protein
MRGTDAAHTWAVIYKILEAEFPEPGWKYEIRRLEDIATKLTIAIIGQFSK